MARMNKALPGILLFSFLITIFFTYENNRLINGIQNKLERKNDDFQNTAKKTVRTSVHKKCSVPPLHDLDEFFNYGKTNGKANICTHIAEMGGKERELDYIYPYNDGSRMVCLDEIKRGSCTVLAFGVGTDITFDIDMEDITKCQVFMFDPTIPSFKMKPPSTMKFFKLGLSDKKGNISIGGSLYEVDRYEGILEMLNLTNHQIDFLKLDVETSELNFFDDVFYKTPHLLDDVRQLGMEVHPGDYKKSLGNMTLLEAYTPFWKVMHELECRGFVPISFVPNLYPQNLYTYNGKIVSGAYDLVYINTKK